MYNDNSIVKVLKEVEISELAGEKVMIDFESGKYLMLKGSANDIWDIMGKETTIGQIVDKLLEIYEVDRHTCTQGTVDFIKKLSEFGFVSIQ